MNSARVKVSVGKNGYNNVHHRKIRCWLYSYAALDARVLLSIAAVLDQQLCDGVVARNHLRRARTRARAAAAAAERDAVAAREARAARAIAVASAASPKDQDDDDNGSVCSSSIGSTVDSRGRRYSASSTASGSDSDTHSSNKSNTEDEKQEKNAQQELQQVHCEYMQQQEDHDHDKLQQLMQTQPQELAAASEGFPTSDVGTSTPFQLDMHDTSTDDMEVQTIEAVPPGRHCYLPWGRDFSTDGR